MPVTARQTQVSAKNACSDKSGARASSHAPCKHAGRCKSGARANAAFENTGKKNRRTGNGEKPKSEI